MKKHLLAGLICCLMAVLLLSAWSPVHARHAQAGPDFPAIDAYIQQQMKQYRIPGVSLAITQGDQIVHQRGFGIAGPSARPMTPQTPMMIGSVSKSFTALAIMQLYEAGKLDLAAPVQRYIPWFSVLPPAGSVADPASPLTYDPAAITIGHLLGHSSGISRQSGERMLADGDTTDTALERHVRSLAQERLDRPVGSGFEYSNANYVTLGLVVQAVSGQSYETYIQQHIFDPLEMKNSFTSQAQALERGMSTGYRQWFGFPIPAENLPFNRGSLPAGSLISSAEDLAHYLIAHSNQGTYKNGSVLSPLGMQAMHLPTGPAQPEGYHKQPSGSYANGWYLMDLNGIPVMIHDGDTPNFHADVALVPSGEWGVALLINTNTVLLGDGIRNMAAGVVSLLAGSQPPAAEISYPVLALYAGMSAFLVFEIYRLIAVLLGGLRPRRPILRVSTPWFWFRKLGLPVFIGSTVGAWMLIGMPRFFQVPFRVMLLNQPDLTWVIAIGGGLAFLNGVLQSGFNGFRIWRPGKSG